MTCNIETGGGGGTGELGLNFRRGLGNHIVCDKYTGKPQVGMAALFPNLKNWEARAGKQIQRFTGR